MTLAKLHLGPNDGKRKLTTLELLLIAGFILFLAYMSLEPLVLPAGSTPQASLAIAAASPAPSAAPTPAEPVAPAQAAAVTSPEAPQAPAEQKAAVSAEPSQVAAEQKPVALTAVDSIKPIFVVTPNSTVLERIAPVATVTIEALAAPAATAEAPAVPVPVSPAATPEPAKVEAAPASAPVAVQAAPVVAEAPKAAAALRFEISDATGVDGFGKNVAQALEQSGVAIAKVASVPAGKQRRTVVLYRDGFEEEAKRLGKLFANAPALVNNTSSRDSADTADVKLVLGSGAAREKNLLASDGALPKLSLGRLARSH